MDLMTLAAKLTLDDKSFQSGIKDAESAGEKLAGKMSAMTIAVGNIAADLIKQGFNAVKNMIGGAVDAYADYQQLIGGVETLFKESSDKVAAYAKQSFKTTGLSANQYMETVTSFSASLLQGLKGDTDAAAELANTAIIDMADNANKMGTDITSIQTAYQGFAKQNFTMLDNLKLGYGGTKEEMVRLINDSGILDKKIKNLDNVTFDQMIEAIHEIQTEMGITGTTAKEAAETISGSKASLVASWNDLMAAVGGAGDMTDMDTAVKNFEESFSAYMTNLLPALTSTVANSGTLVSAVADSIASLPTDLLSRIGDAGLESGTEMVGGVGKIVNWLIDNLITMFQNISIDSSKVTEFGSALGEFLGNTIANIAGNIDVIAEGIVNLGVSLAGSLIEGLFKGLFGLGSEADQVTDELKDSLFTIDTQTTEADALLNYMEKLAEKYGESAKETLEWKDAEVKLEEILKGSGTVFEEYGSDIEGAVKKLKEMNDELRKTAIINAIEKATAEEQELLATQTLAYEKQVARKERNEDAISTYEQNLRNDIMKYAAEQAASYLDENGNLRNENMINDYKEFKNLSEGLSDAGGELVKLDSLDFEGLKGIVEWMANEDLAESVAADEELIAKAQVEIENAETEMGKIQKEIDATKEAIADTKVAMDRAITELFQSGEKAGKSIQTGGETIQLALTALGMKIANFQFKSPVETLFESVWGPHATGIDYVPYDGFRAELHKGEAVITRDENERRNGGMDYGALEASLEDAIERSMARINFNMNGERVGDITTKRISQNIMNSERSYKRAMGG